MLEKSDLESYQNLQKYLEKLDVSKEFENTAESLYEEAHEKELYYGKTVEEFSSGIFYNVNKLVDGDLNCNKISSELDCDKDQVLKSARDINKKLGLKVGPECIDNYYEQLKDELEVDEEVAEEAKKILDKCREASLHSGKSVYAFVGSAFYSASQINGSNLTQREIAEVSGVSKVTLRKQYRQQLEEYEN